MQWKSSWCLVSCLTLELEFFLAFAGLGQTRVGASPKEFEALSDAEIAALELWDAVPHVEAMRQARSGSPAIASKLDELSDAEISALELWDELETFEASKVWGKDAHNSVQSWMASMMHSRVTVPPMVSVVQRRHAHSAMLYAPRTFQLQDTPEMYGTGI